MSFKAFKGMLETCPIRVCSTTQAPERERRNPSKSSLKDRVASWELYTEKIVSNNKAGDEISGILPQTNSHPLETFSTENLEKNCSEIGRSQNPKDKPSKEKFHSGIHIGTRPSKLAGISSTPISINSESDEEEEIDEVLQFKREEKDNRGSEAGLFVQPQPVGPFEPLVLSDQVGSGAELIKSVRVPAAINARLLEHQREGVRFLYNLYVDNRGGILGDDMGLGKTIQSIAFLAAILEKDEDVLDITGLTLSVEAGSLKVTCEKVVLIICPTSVLQNWAREFRAWGDFKISIFHGLQREIVMAKLGAKELEVVLTSHDTFRIHGDDLCGIKWDCVIVDEVHRLKNDKSRLYGGCVKMPTKRRYGLTGTIMQNQFMELFNVFDWAAPGCLGERAHFREYYALPLKEGQRISAPENIVERAEHRKKHLITLLQRYFLRRTKEETIAHLMMGKEDNVVFCAMSSVQKRAYQRLLRSPDFQALTNKDLPCSCGSPLTRAECCFRIVPNGVIWSHLHRENQEGCDFCPFCLVLPCLTKLQQVSNHLELIKPNPKDDLKKQRKDAEFAAMALGEDASLVGGIQQDETFLGLSDAQYCGKMRALEKLLGSWIPQRDKVLLFSYSVKMIDILEKFLIRKGYCFSRLDGGTPMAARQSLVEDFNDSPSKQIFLISTRAGGLGLNLVSANRVVIFDPNWNPAHDLQAQDRSFRYGQHRHVTVFRLLAAGSLEELVYTRQIYKQQLFNIAVTGAPEKRYFEGVQGSKEHKGELFGISNLLRDISQKVFAEDLIENHQERLLRVQQGEPLQEWVNHGLEAANPITELNEYEGNSVCTVVFNDTRKRALEHNETEDEQLQDECRPHKEFNNVLTHAGVLYLHRNEDVVNQRPTGTPAESTVNKRYESTVCDGSAMIGGRTGQVRSKEKERKTRKLRTQASSSSRGASKPAIAKCSRSNSTVDKQAFFKKLAIFRGLEETEFSEWLLSTSRQQMENLLCDYQRSLSEKA